MKGGYSPDTYTETRGDHDRNQKHRNRQLSTLIVNIETDERIITAIARNKARARWNATARCIAKFWTVIDAKLGDNFQSPECAMMTERADVFFFSGPRLCWYSELFEIFGSFRDLAPESCIKGENHSRGGVLKSTLVVDNDSVHTQHAFSLIVLTICSHSSLMRTLRNGSRKHPRQLVTQSHNISSFSECHIYTDIFVFLQKFLNSSVCV